MALEQFHGVETLVVNGMQDLLTPPDHSEAIVRLVPGAEHVVIDEAGHIIMLEHPEVISEHSSRSSSAGCAPPRRASTSSASRGCATVVTDLAKRRRVARARRRDRDASRVAGAGSAPPAVRVGLPSAEDTRAWGERPGRVLRAGDLVVLTGDLGAGKTTLTQGIAEGLGAWGPVTSPTFVIARVHPSLVGGPARWRMSTRTGSAGSPSSTTSTSTPPSTTP